MNAFNLEEKYRPQTLDGFAGLTTVKRVMKALIRKPYESAWLLSGSPGTAKTSVAFAVAKAIGAEVHHMPSRRCNLEVVEELARSFQYKPMFGKFRVAIFDEADKMTLAAQHVILSMIDGTATPQSVIFFFTANPEDNGEIGLEPRFISRCRQLKFDGQVELEASVAYLTDVWKKESRRPVPDIRQLLVENNGDIRSAFNALELELIASGTSVGLARKPEKRNGKQVASITDHKRAGNRKLIYTIGYENLTPQRFRQIVDGLKITIIIDCRAIPASRIGGFSMTALQNDYGSRYVWKGEMLGGRQTGTKQTGVKWLADFMRDGKQVPLLLGKAESPGACHRHFNLAIPLLRRNAIDAQHICDNEIVAASELQRAIDEDNEYSYETLAV